MTPPGAGTARNNGRGERSVERHVARTGSVSEAVVLAVSEATGRPAFPGSGEAGGALVPLSDSVDPDALDHLFRGDASGRVVFDYAGCEVVVLDGIRVVVTPQE